MHFRYMISTMAIATGALAQDTVHIYPNDTNPCLELYNVSNEAPFQVFDESFKVILGDSPIITNILNSSNASFPQFHEAAIFVSESTLFVTSNQYAANSPSTNNKAIAITRIEKTGNTWSSTIIEQEGIALPNGGTTYKDGLVFCDQGSLTKPGGLVYMNASAPYNTKTLINHYYGVEFNSPNDVHVTSDGAMWFTDPSYGSWQGIRPQPQLPNHVYRYVPETNQIRVVADGLQEPNGITFSPDEKTAYISDGMGNRTNPVGPRTIYAYDVIFRGSVPFLSNRRVFAVPGNGLPDGIKTDAAGNLYAGCGDGVNVWNEGGILLGKIALAGGAANFILGTEGDETQMWLLNEDKLWQASLGLISELDGFVR